MHDNLLFRNDADSSTESKNKNKKNPGLTKLNASNEPSCSKVLGWKRISENCWKEGQEWVGGVSEGDQRTQVTCKKYA